VWDDASVDWSRFRLVVVRSAWDYAERWREFLRWAASVRQLENPLPVLQFGVDKERYLTTLSDGGVPVVPTSYHASAEGFVPWEGPIVVKPAISAGGRRSARFEAGDSGALELVAEITRAGETAMVQPFLDCVPETSLVFVDDAYSHSLARRAALPLGGAEEVLYLDEQLGSCEATEEERQVARAALDLVPGRTLYARVDLLGGAVLELEVVEPSLYLSFSPSAADRLAAAVAARLAAEPHG
jgi:glutathione synthase/RimK-type ligase-like ATP-grasp enzyme